MSVNIPTCLSVFWQYPALAEPNWHPWFTWREECLCLILAGSKHCLPWVALLLSVWDFLLPHLLLLDFAASLSVQPCLAFDIPPTGGLTPTFQECFPLAIHWLKCRNTDHVFKDVSSQCLKKYRAQKTQYSMLDNKILNCLVGAQLAKSKVKAEYRVVVYTLVQDAHPVKPTLVCLN